MARRSTAEKVQVATANVTSGASPVTVVTAGADDVVAPKQIVIANAGGAAATVTVACGSTTILTMVVPAGSTEQMTWWDGLECDKGDSLTVSTDQTVDVTVNYVVHDESAGVTKVQSRANTYNNVTVTRTPSNVIGNDKS